MSDKVMQNLMEAFAGESQASRKYWAYAKRLKQKAGRMQPSCSEQHPKQKPCMLKAFESSRKAFIYS